MALIKSNKSGVICPNCTNVITVGSWRNVKHGTHEHARCPRFLSLTSDDTEQGYLNWLMDDFKTSKELNGD